MRTYTAQEMPDDVIERGIGIWKGPTGAAWLADEGIKPERIEHFRSTAIRLLSERKIIWNDTGHWRPMMELVLEEGRRTLFGAPEPEVDGWGDW